jgi:hypothetical protein
LTPGVGLGWRRDNWLLRNTDRVTYKNRRAR